jgi:hypothetical protein
LFLRLPGFEQHCDGSVEVVGTNVYAGDIELRNALGLDVDHALLILQLSFDLQKTAACYDKAVPLKDIGRKDDVGDAGFVFEREKDKTLGSAGALTGDDATGYTDELIANVAF